MISEMFYKLIIIAIPIIGALFGLWFSNHYPLDNAPHDH